MAKNPKVHEPQRERTPIPHVGSVLPVVNPGFDRLASTLNAFVQQTEDQLDKETVRRAKVAGALAGMDRDFSPTRGATLAEQAYDASALDVYYNRTVIDASNSLNRIVAESQGNPFAISERAKAVAAEMSASLPEEIQPRFINSFMQLTQSQVNQAHNQLRAAKVAEHEATFNEAEDVFTRNISSLARAGDHEAVQTAVDLYTDTLRRNGPITEGGTGVLSPVDIQDRLKKTQQLVERNVIIGQFESIKDPMEQIQFVHDLTDRGQLMKLVGGKDSSFTEDEVDALQAEMYSMMSRSTSVEGSVDAARVRELNRTRAAAEVSFWREPSEEGLAVIENLSVLTGNASGVKSMRGYLATGGAMFETDPATVSELRRQMRGLENGPPVTPDRIYSLIGKGLSPDDAKSLEQEWLDIQDRGTDFVQTNEWKEAKRRIISKFNLPVNPLTGQIEAMSGADAKRSKIANELLSSTFDNVSKKWEKFLKEGGDRPDILGLVRMELDRIEKANPDLFQTGFVRTGDVDYGATGYGK